MSKNPLISIIIPVYNVEKYIAKCATTLFEQDFDSIEYIFVNDCSPDNSMQILQSVIEKYPNRKNDIKIVNNAQNSGSSLTRKNGLDNANGEYILFIDSDDWVELDMVSSMYKKAKNDNADIVWCDYYLNYENKEIYCKEKYDEIKNNDYLKACLSGSVNSYIWNKLVKNKLYENLEFPKFSLFEDTFIMTQLFYKTKKISYLPKAFLHYNQMNLSSIVSSNSIEKKINDSKEMYNSVCNFLIQNNIYDKYIKDVKMRIVWIVLVVANSDYINRLKNIDKSLVNIEFVLQNPLISKFKKIFYTLPFIGLEWCFTIPRDIYRNIKAIIKGKNL